MTRVSGPRTLHRMPAGRWEPIRATPSGRDRAACAAGPGSQHTSQAARRGRRGLRGQGLSRHPCRRHREARPHLARHLLPVLPEQGRAVRRAGDRSRRRDAGARRVARPASSRDRRDGTRCGAGSASSWTSTTSTAPSSGRGRKPRSEAPSSGASAPSCSPSSPACSSGASPRPRLPISIRPIAALALVAMLERLNYYALTRQVTIDRDDDDRHARARDARRTVRRVAPTALRGDRAAATPAPRPENPGLQIAELGHRSGVRDFALDEHDRVVGDRERVVHVLLDDEQRGARVADASRASRTPRRRRAARARARARRRSAAADARRARARATACAARHPRACRPAAAPFSEPGEELIRLVERLARLRAVPGPAGT